MALKIEFENARRRAVIYISHTLFLSKRYQQTTAAAKPTRLLLSRLFSSSSSNILKLKKNGQKYFFKSLLSIYHHINDYVSQLSRNNDVLFTFMKFTTRMAISSVFGISIVLLFFIWRRKYIYSIEHITGTENWNWDLMLLRTCL